MPRTETGQALRYAWAALNYVASCGSSTNEGASDVSLFHACLTPPLHLPVAVCFGFVGLVVCVCFPGFASARVVLVVFSSRVLDDRQCFTARSARHKKKLVLPCRDPWKRFPRALFGISFSIYCWNSVHAMALSSLMSLWVKITDPPESGHITVMRYGGGATGS